MTTRMSMRERHQKVEELVMQDPQVLDCSHRFCDAQREINEWHVRNNPPSCATMGQLKELDELINYSAFCLEDLKCAKTAAYNQLMSQYPHVWDTTCDDPFDTGTQNNATDTGAETEEMEEVPADTECPRIPLAEVKNILTKWETDYKGFRDFLAGRGLNPDGAGCAIFAIKEIRDDINKLTTTEEAPNA